MQEDWCIFHGVNHDPVIIQMNAVSVLTHYYFKGYFNVMLPSMPRSHKCSLPFMFSDYSFISVYHFSCVLHAPSISSSRI